MVFRGLLFTAMLSSALSGQDAHQHHAGMAAAAGNQVVAVASLRIPDVELVDQHGKKVHFYSDLVKGKVVAINTVFTTCTTICPLMGANFAKLSNLMSEE